MLEFHGFQQNEKRGMRKCINILASFYVKTTITTVFLFILAVLGKHFACDQDPSATLDVQIDMHLNTLKPSEENSDLCKI